MNLTWALLPLIHCWVCTGRQTTLYSQYLVCHYFYYKISSLTSQQNYHYSLNYSTDLAFAHVCVCVYNREYQEVVNGETHLGPPGQANEPFTWPPWGPLGTRKFTSPSHKNTWISIFVFLVFTFLVFLQVFCVRI